MHKLGVASAAVVFVLTGYAVWSTLCDSSFTISGVVRASQGRPIADARVCAASADGDLLFGPASACANSDAQGRYSLTVVHAKHYDVSASGFALASEAHRLAVSVWHRAPELDLTLAEHAQPLRGVVVDATGTPLPRARVRVLRRDPRMSLDVETDSRGRFDLWLSPGWLELVAEAKGYAPSHMGRMVPNTAIRMTLVPGASVSGVVVKSNGVPVSGIEVRALPIGRIPTTRPVRSDAQGAFTIEGLEPGNYALRGVGPGSYGEQPGYVAVRLGDRIDGAVVQIGRALALRGRILFTDGGGSCGAGSVLLGRPDFEMSSQLARTKQDISLKELGPEQERPIELDGTVYFPGVPPGHYYVSVQCDDHVLSAGPRELLLKDGSDTDLSWTVSPGLTLDVRVIDARGKPVSYAPFRLTTLDEDGPRLLTLYRANASGELQIRGLTKARYELASSDGPLRGRPVILEPRTGSGRLQATLALDGSGRIDIDLKTTSGVALERARVLALHSDAVAGSDGSARLEASELGGGRYIVSAVPSGHYELVVDDGIHPEGHGLDSQPFWVADGATFHAAVVLDRSATIRGRVDDPEGRPAPGVWISAIVEVPSTAQPTAATVNLLGGRAGVLTRGDGSFEIGGLEPGMSYQIRFEGRAGIALQKHAVIAPGSLNVRLPLPATVAGIGVAGSGEPLQRFLVRATHRETASVQERSFLAADGRFSIDELSPGAVELQLITPEGDSTSTLLDLTPAQRRDGLRMVVTSRAEAGD